ncbi:protein FAM204A [Ascaphus truei]|uniref:protein FAM204A n=1 Tax=Ascaphus truei TaxID=8439 RepID=UPI003F59E428
MWSGLLPPGMTESDVSEDDEAAQELVLPPARADSTEKDAGSPSCPTGVPRSSWDKFLDLQKKHRELKTQANQRGKRKRRRKGKSKHKLAEDAEKNTSPSPEKVAALDTLQQYFGINDRLEPPVCNKILKKSMLEDSLDQAVKRGDIEAAEELSDKLATREMAVKITKAVSCHKYLKAKEEQEASQESQQKNNNLAWGFEAKKRWETKSNMGYM